MQGRELWVIGWFAGLCLVLLLRWRLLQKFLHIRNKSYFPYQWWHDRFLIGVIATGLMLGVGAAWLMPYVTANVQIILHAILLTMCPGAIAYLSTSLRAYFAYMITIMMPVTIWLFAQQNLSSFVLSALYIFFMVAGYISVKRMNELVNDALYYRYDNENLIEDLQRLLQSVSQTNKALEKISTSDELTGLSNYRAFRVNLEEAWRQYQGSNLQLSLIKLNVDYYHEFNACYGEDRGDQHLRQIAAMLSQRVSQQSQTVARLQGAEFAVLMPGEGCEEAKKIVLDVMQALAHEKIEHAKSPLQKVLTISVGLGCQSVAPGSSSRELLVRADTALKLAKERGHNRLEVLEG
jgi:diguanylate cyclase (GGDEF)-like protein